MSLVDAETGEVVDILDPDSARNLCKRITRQSAKVNVEAGQLVELCAEALKGKAWVALGFGSWADLCDDQGWEFNPRTSTDRAALAQVMRKAGMSFRAIGKVIGASEATIRRDAGASNDAPAEVAGTDGKTYPSTRPDLSLVEDLTGNELDDGEAEAILEELDAAGIDPSPENVGHAADEAVESREEPAITKPDLGGGVSHPARFSDAIIEQFANLLGDETQDVLDPFAGTGRIHELARWGHTTTGIELEPEWADLHDRTTTGSALELPFGDGTFTAIATSPTYGNRLADSHNASDPHLRRSYTHDLGRTLHEDNSGAMQWGASYREFHAAAWAEAHRVLQPHGLFLLNIKDHIRDGVQQPVTAWHVAALTALGFQFDAAQSGGVTTQHLRQGATSERAGQELILVFVKVAP